jgi:predicted nuclease of predicted toxin-antitoxin system
MVPLLVDENFNHRILRGLKRRLPALDALLIQETDIVQYDDPTVLAWAAAHHRVVITHDVNTMTRYAYTRLEAGQPIPGIVIVPKELAIGSAIEELVILLTRSSPEEFPNRVIHLPL